MKEIDKGNKGERFCEERGMKKKDSGMLHEGKHRGTLIKTVKFCLKELPYWGVMMMTMAGWVRGDTDRVCHVVQENDGKIWKAKASNKKRNGCWQGFLTRVSYYNIWTADSVKEIRIS